MVPEPLWGRNLRDSLKKSEWDRLRKARFISVGNVCEICGGVGSRYAVGCHEIWEYDDQNRIQILRGLMALCPACSDVKHYGLACEGGRGEEAKARLMKFNGWTVTEADAYVEQERALWHKRSEVEWTQDISWLETTKKL